MTNKKTPENLPQIGEFVHFLAQSGRCCAAVVTSVEPLDKQLLYSVWVVPEGKMDTIHDIYQCQKASCKASDGR